MESRVTSMQELETLARSWLATIKASDDHATIVALGGDLGAGKTAFTKMVGSILNIPEIIQSPTFVIERRYNIPEPAMFKMLVHIDAYRIEDPAELSRLHWNETKLLPRTLIMVEWPEKVSAILSPEYRLQFKFIDDNTRTIITT